MSGSGISWDICKSAPSSRQITTPAPHRSVFLQAGCPCCRPTNSVKALKAKCRHAMKLILCRMHGQFTSTTTRRPYAYASLPFTIGAQIELCQDGARSVIPYDNRGSMHLLALPVCPIRPLQQRTAGLPLWTRQEGDIDRLLHGQCRRSK